jgi:hypothetical protein
MTGLEQMEHNIARCRVVLSIAASVVIYIDVETPLLARWFPFVSGPSPWIRGSSSSWRPT